MHQSSHPGQQTTVIQASLEINKEDDEHEKEANHFKELPYTEGQWIDGV